MERLINANISWGQLITQNPSLQPSLFLVASAAPRCLQKVSQRYEDASGHGVMTQHLRRGEVTA